MTPVSRRRLLKLADYLETKVPRRRFYYGHWVGEDWAGAADLSCGTTACALGWATTIPSFRRAGLGLRPNGQVFFGICDGIYAAESFFDITHEAAREIFARPSDVFDHDRAKKVTPKQIAKRIRRFVKESLNE